MHCKTCNTRLESEDAVCPNCGKSSGGPALSDEQPLASARAVPKFASPSALAKLGGIADQSSTAEAKSTSAGKKKLPKRKVKASTPPGRLSATKKSSSPRPAPRVTRPGRKKPSAVPPKPTAPRSAKPSVPTGTAKPGFPAVKMKTSELRELVAARPELLEEGLEVFADGQGRPVGAAYSCEVGEIDLLARDARGDIVVVMVAEDKPGDEIVPALLKRIGWARTHLSSEVESVRGIVVLSALSEEVRYAAAAVAGTVDFKTYRVQVVFEDIEH